MVQIRIYLGLLIFILFLPDIIYSQPTGEAENRGKLPQGYYISINPIALAAFIPSEVTKDFGLPFLHNLESGVSLAGGYYFSQLQLEGRVVLGSPSSLIFCPQLHAGIRAFPFRNKENNVIPLGFGFFIRSWDTYYTHSELQYLNVSPQLNVGYLIKRKKFFYDFRIGLQFAVATWSNLEYSTPMADFIGIPSASINIGYNF